MTIQHTVVFKLRYESGSDEERDFLDTARRELVSIPEVENFSINRQISQKSNLTWQFSMYFTSQEAYDAYNGHPRHIAFVNSRWVPDVETFQEYDFIAL